jgi:YesN/AraC family two-component response regulator
VQGQDSEYSRAGHLPLSYSRPAEFLHIHTGIADGYIVKPTTSDEIAEKVREQLKKQEEQERFDEERMAEFIETRPEEHEAKNPGEAWLE